MKKILLSAFVSLAALTAGAELINMGYANDDVFYTYTGMQTNQDGEMGAAIKLPAAMFEKYADARAIAISIGLGQDVKNFPAKAFLRRGSLNSEDVATGTEEVSFNPKGWENIAFDTEWTVPANLEDDIYVGYFINCPKDKFVIYTSMHNCAAPKGQCWMTNVASNEAAGKEMWYDLSTIPGTVGQNSNLCIRLILEMPDGSHSNVVFLNNAIVGNVGTLGADDIALFFMRNDGTNTVNSVEVTTTLGDAVHVEEVDLKNPMAPGSESTRGISMNMHYLGTGEHTIEITKVNGVENNAATANRTATVNVLAVPEYVAENFTKRPVLEYYCSESAHFSGVNQDDCIRPIMGRYMDQVTYLPHNAGDKFAQNVRDTSAWVGDQQTTLSLSDGDRLLIASHSDMMNIMMPSTCVDRTQQVNKVNLMGQCDGVFTSALYPQAQEYCIVEQLHVPTFASIDLTSEYDAASGQVKINAAGSIVDGILPEGENLRLAIFLLEESVKSDSQEFPDDSNYLARYPDGIFTHYAVVRSTLTDFWGEEIAAGDFAKTYTATLDNPFINPDHMKVVALLQRPETNDRWHRDIINSAEIPMTDTFEQTHEYSSINSVTAPGQKTLYNLNGVRVSNASTPGIYIERSAAGTRKILVK